MLDPAARLIELAGRKPRIALAFSGGIDSTVLAHLLIQRRRLFTSLRLIHVDHGLQAASGEWSRQCEAQARAWRLPFVALVAEFARRPGDSPEAAARDARYALLFGAAEPGEVLVTAQHRDDQAETVLLQLFRGAGVAGLAAMPAFDASGKVPVARPLLDVSRAEIEAVARHARLEWIEDPSNADTRFARNFLRQRLMPSIREYWPGADKAIARSSAHMAAAATLLEELGARDLAALADGAGVSVAKLRALPVGRRRNALRAFIGRHGVEMPEASRLREMSGPLLAARVDALPEVRWAEARMVRAAGRLELQDSRESQSEFSGKSWCWQNDRRLILESGEAEIELIDDAEGPIDLELLPKTLELRARAGGEKLRPGPRARTKTLKALMQSARIAAGDRARLPLLFAGDRLIVAGDRWVDASITANVKSRRRARLQWTRKR